VRVVAGRLGGRKLRAPRGDSTRPTADRVKEALFSILGPIDGARALDLFAGTGALGIEAISRGAAHAVLVEGSAAVVAVIRANLEDLSITDEATVVTGTIPRVLPRVGALGPFDIVFADPPYASLAVAIGALATLAASRAVTEHAIAVLEHAARDEPEAEGWAVEKRRQFGDTALTILVRP